MKRFFFCCLFIAKAAFLFSQSAEDVDRLLAQPIVLWGEASFWTLASAGEIYSERDAAFFAVKYKAMPNSADLNEPADLAGIALLIMRAYNLRGGLFYSLFQNRRYAFREFVYEGIFGEDDDPSDAMSGKRFLQILNIVNTKANHTTPYRGAAGHFAKE